MSAVQNKQTNKKQIVRLKWSILVNGSSLFYEPVFVAPTTNTRAHTHRRLAASLQSHFAALESIVWGYFEFL